MKYILKRVFKIYFLLSLCFVFFLLGSLSTYNNNFVFKWLYGSIVKVENLIQKNEFLQNDNYKILNEFEDYIIFIQESGKKITLTSEKKTIFSWNLDEFNDFQIRPYGLHLFTNGNLLISSDSENSISTLMLINKNSKILWKKINSIHHWFDVYDEKIYYSNRKFINLEKIKKKYSNLKSNFLDCKKNTITDEPTKYENIIISNLKGEVIKEIDILKLVLQNENLNYLINDCIDPLHINDVQIIKTKISNKKININPGDIMISIRNMNTVIFLDKINFEIKWYLCCTFHRQHSPKINKNNNLVLFDNLGSLYFSKISEINLFKKNIVGSFYGNINNYGKKELFFSDSRGFLDLSYDKILISSTNQNIIFELNCKEKYLSPKCDVKEIIKTNSGPTFAKYIEKKDYKFLLDL